MKTLSEKLKNYIIKSAKEGKRVEYFIGGLSFMESSFFPIPPDVFLIPAVIINRKKWITYALWVSVMSVLGALFGYVIGSELYTLVAVPIIEFYGLEADVVKIADFLNDNAFLGIFVSAFTPIPYKVFTITSGAFAINIITFISASILGRSLRFFAEAFIFQKYGDKLGGIFFKYFNLFTILFMLAILAFIFIL